MDLIMTKNGLEEIKKIRQCKNICKAIAITAIAIFIFHRSGEEHV